MSVSLTARVKLKRFYPFARTALLYGSQDVVDEIILAHTALCFVDNAYTSCTAPDYIAKQVTLTPPRPEHTG